MADSESFLTGAVVDGGLDGFRGSKKSLRIPGIPTNCKYVHSLIRILDLGFRWKNHGSNDSFLLISA